MNINRLTIGTIGLVAIIAIGSLYFQQRRLALSGAENERLRSEAAQLPEMQKELKRLQQLKVDQAELKRLRQEQASNQAELIRFRARATQIQQAEAEVARLRNPLKGQNIQGSESTNSITGIMSEQMQDALMRITQRQLSRMQARLNLSPAQSQTIQEILSRKAQGMAEATKGMLAGKIDREKMASYRQGNRETESQIRALLSPEQQTAYVALQEEEKLTQARAFANSELVQMNNSLELTEEQLDKVFTVLYTQALQQNKAEAEEPHSTNPAATLQSALDGRLRALESVLTPTQLAAYRQQQEVQIKYIKRMAGQMENQTAQP